jgi:hypothetical protein
MITKQNVKVAFVFCLQVFLLEVQNKYAGTDIEILNSTRKYDVHICEIPWQNPLEQSMHT